MESFFGIPDDAELTMGSLGGLGDIEIEYPDPANTGGYGGWPGSQQQTTPEVVYASYMAKLRAIGYPQAPDSGNAYDPAVRAAIAAFQQDYGLDVDGLGGQGSRTFAAIDQVFNAQQEAPQVTPGDAPPPFVPGDLPLNTISDVETSGPNWLLYGGVAAVLGVGAWYFWGR